MKLTKIVLEENKGKKRPYGHTLIPKSFDKETGTYTSDVEYTPLRNVKKNIEDLHQDFLAALKDHPEDTKLQDLQATFAKFKTAFNKHTNKVYGKL